MKNRRARLPIPLALGVRGAHISCPFGTDAAFLPRRMSTIAAPPPITVWKDGPWTWVMFGLLLALGIAVFGTGLVELWPLWRERPEYSFGMFIPFLSVFLVWQRKNRLECLPARGSYWGLALLTAGIALRVVGDLATSYVLIQYGCLAAIVGVAWSYLGGAGLRVVLVPLAFLLFALPLPEFLLQALSLQLQLVSSEIGVAMIRAVGISVHLEGNVIDLGAMRLQVAEACSGLRYLFSLATLAFITAYFYRGPLWHRAAIVLSAVPITVAMNSLRIALVGVSVETFGQSAGEGLMHYFEGLTVFLAATGLLLAVVWLFARMRSRGAPIVAAFGLEFPASTPRDSAVARRSIPRPLMAACAILACAAALLAGTPERLPHKPERTSFDSFPMRIDGWRGYQEKLGREFQDILLADDHIVADFTRGNEAVSVYVQYYAAQSRAAATHSPRLCIPAGGWEIVALEDRALQRARYGGEPLRVNRVVITRDDASLLVYYWFQQRGRNTTNEYATKMLIFWDAVTRNRSDGSMVRLMTAIRPGQGLAPADALLEEWADRLMPILPRYVPD